jgi:hypothetical protein
VKSERLAPTGEVLWENDLSNFVEKQGEQEINIEQIRV